MPDGYYLWIPRSGTTESKAKFGSSETKTYLQLTGDCYVPKDGGGYRIMRLSTEETLSYDKRANVMLMIAAARGDGRIAPESEAEWAQILNRPMIVRVTSDPWHPKIEGSKDRDETVTYYSTGIKGAPMGWPAGVALPEGVKYEPAPDLNPPDITEAPAAAATEAPATNGAEAPNPNAEGPPPAPAASGRVDPEWLAAQKALGAAIWTALRGRFDWTEDAEESHDEAHFAFWRYFDGVPAVRKLKHEREGGVPSLYWSPEQGGTTDALQMALEAVSRFNQGQDVRPPMPGMGSGK